MKRLAIISTHPIQYNAPFFKELNLNAGITVKVFYTWSQSKDKVYDPGFKRNITWDIPLFEGYEYEFIKNVSWAPGSHHFFGIINPSIIKKIKNWAPDYLLVYGWSFLTHLYCIKHFKNKVPVLFRGDSTLLDETKGVRTVLRRALLKWVYRSIDVALYVGANNYEYYKKHNVDEKSLRFLPHAIDNNRFRNLPATNQDNLFAVIKEKTKDKIVFLFAGKFEEKKDPVIIISAFKKLSNKNCAVVFIGEGVLELTLKNSAGENPDIHFLPFQNQSCIAEAYRLGDVLILPSIYNETWGLAVNEAMACGLAIIVSDKVGCAKNLIKNDCNGYTFPAGNINEICSRMELMCNYERLQQMKNVSLQMIKEYSISENVIRLHSILADLN